MYVICLYPQFGESYGVKAALSVLHCPDMNLDWSRGHGPASLMVSTSAGKNLAILMYRPGRRSRLITTELIPANADITREESIRLSVEQLLLINSRRARMLS